MNDYDRSTTAQHHPESDLVNIEHAVLQQKSNAEAAQRRIFDRAREALRGFSQRFRALVTANYFAPRTAGFWRSLIVAFCVCCLLGHWLEGFYCLNMDYCFDIVEPDYAIYIDPWFHPYWVYGFGAVGMTLLIEPVKELIVRNSRTAWSAFLKTFGLAVFLAMAMELGFGLLINQPDAMGEYPFWDNSEFPLNILGQAWLVNDVFIGLAAMLYVWLIFPLICKGFSMLKPRTANIVLACIVGAFCIICALSYGTLILSGAWA